MSSVRFHTSSSSSCTDTSSLKVCPPDPSVDTIRTFFTLDNFVHIPLDTVVESENIYFKKNTLGVLERLNII